ncbi:MULTISPECIES: RNA polymerase sigma factor [unclassified Thauera]|uniref:RNA polymerase sigma factor n=1 Tax=unclassified Thauera TaxID=2609274 RepID=UPI0021E16CDD|nr:RNA polymerase sigma factor [Thauera sp. Sel9]MCV2216320.1 RNA polymerase sigma factor [Thauera sp. Sel9]
MYAKDASSSLVVTLAHHYDGLVAYLCRKLGFAQGNARATRDLAHEALHEVCLQLLKEEPQLGKVRVPIAFLRTLSQRRAIDVLRREAAWNRFAVCADEHPEFLSHSAPRTSEAEYQLDARQRIALLAQAIESLPPRCRDVFVLHKVHEWTQADVAAHLGISVKAVEKHIRVGLACCRVAMAGYLDDEA